MGDGWRTHEERRVENSLFGMLFTSSIRHFNWHLMRMDGRTDESVAKKLLLRKWTGAFHKLRSIFTLVHIWLSSLQNWNDAGGVSFWASVRSSFMEWCSPVKQSNKQVFLGNWHFYATLWEAIFQNIMTFSAGDEVLAVNGLALQGMSHSEAISVFKNIRSGRVVLHVARRDAAARRWGGTTICPDLLIWIDTLVIDQSIYHKIVTVNANGVKVNKVVSSTTDNPICTGII